MGKKSLDASVGKIVDLLKLMHPWQIAALQSLSRITSLTRFLRGLLSSRRPAQAVNAID
jgi:hypothetical protein